MSYMFHYPNVKWTLLQAEAIGVPQVTAQTPGVKEAELTDLARVLSEAKERHAIDAVYTGALASAYQKTRVEKVCDRLGLRCISPLWGIDPEVHLHNLVSEGFSVMVVSVSALGLGEEWLGRTLGPSSVEELVALGRKYKFHAGLEGGEGETFVLDSPLFFRRIEVRSSVKHWNGDSGYLDITDAVLVEKSRQTAQAA